MTMSEEILHCLAYELQGYISTIQWFLMYTSIGKLICYTRSFFTIQVACLEEFHCNIATYMLSDNLECN